MNPLDARTVIFSYIFSDGICAFVIGSLWIQDRRRFAGLGLWLADFVAQFVALLLIALRGRIPDFISATVSNALIIGGTILLYIGLEKFVDKPSRQIHNVILLAVFTFTHSYFIFVYPSLDVRTIILSVGLLVICSQCAWLMLHRVSAEMRSFTRTVGIIFIAFCLISLIRIFVDLILPTGNDFFHSDLLDTSLVMAYQMCFIILTLGLFLMVNRRLVVDLENDIVERKRAEDQAHDLARFPSENPNPVLRLDRDGNVLYANTASSFLLLDWRCTVGDQVSLFWQQQVSKVLAEQKNLTIDVSVGDIVYSFFISAAKGADYVNLYGQDITERKKAEEKLRQLSRAVEQSPASILITDTTGRIEYVNSRFTQLTGYDMEEVIGQNPRILKSGQTPPETYHQLWKALRQGQEFRAEFINKKKNGDLYYEYGILSPILDSQGAITHYLAVNEDISERKRADAEIQRLQTQLREQAIRDPLTGLYNRRYLEEGLDHELARALREKSSICFVMIDIDHFKRLNDALGHLAGDAVLKKLAAQILSQSRAADIVCRYGGEEFLVVLPNTTAELAFQIAERWRKSFLDATLPFESPHELITISCGVSEFPLHGGTREELIGAADTAMYQAKAAGRNRVIIWQHGRVETSTSAGL